MIGWAVPLLPTRRWEGASAAGTLLRLRDLGGFEDLVGSSLMKTEVLEADAPQVVGETGDGGGARV